MIIPLLTGRRSNLRVWPPFTDKSSFARRRIQDTRPREFVIEDDRTQQRRTVAPDVPFDSELLSDDKHLRTELAAWVMHPQNRRFRRAIANRVWGMMFGRAYVSPVDDLPDPPSPESPDVLDLLAEDLADHDDDLRRLIHVIAATRAFGLSSAHQALGESSSAAKVEEAWAVFPVSELDPQQMVRTMQQAATARTLRAEDANTFVAIRRYEHQSRFVRDYGIAGDADDAQASTIPHTVHRLSGNDTRLFSDAGWLTAPGRIAAMSSDAESCLENCYLACLTRRPTPEEQTHFLPQLQGGLKAPRDRRGRYFLDVVQLCRILLEPLTDVSTADSPATRSVTLGHRIGNVIRSSRSGSAGGRGPRRRAAAFVDHAVAVGRSQSTRNLGSTPRDKIGGPTQAIATSIPGVKIAAGFPMLASNCIICR